MLKFALFFGGKKFLSLYLYVFLMCNPNKNTYQYMKKYLLTMMALILGIGLLQAGPVDVKRAELVGQQFAQATM